MSVGRQCYENRAGAEKSFTLIGADLAIDPYTIPGLVIFAGSNRSTQITNTFKVSAVTEHFSFTWW